MPDLSIVSARDVIHVHDTIAEFNVHGLES